MTNPLPPLLLRGDCLVELQRIPDASVDAVVTDPPYGLEFMGKTWDKFTPLDFEMWCSKWAGECLRILKPGGHLLAFGGSRTWHRLAAGIEDAGFELRDSIAWLYGSGFPKSLDVSKAIDKAAGAEREVVSSGKAVKRMIPGADQDRTGSWIKDNGREFIPTETTPATDAARQWEGWGTALKPAFEPVVVARKPLISTVAANVLEHGTGALNIDASRIAATDKAKFPAGVVSDTERVFGGGKGMHGDKPRGEDMNPSGRWPANVILDESQAAALDEQTGELTSGANPAVRNADKFRTSYGGFTGARNEQPRRGTDSGGGSRFFYVAKAPKSERPVVDGVAHPTVKPLALMRYLVKLVTPPGGCVVDPFAGSGATLEAAYLEGFECIGVELTPDYWPLIQSRIDRVTT